MASFTDLVADWIRQRLDEFQENIASTPGNDLERLLAERVRTHWHRLDHVLSADKPQGLNGAAAAVDGSQAVHALNTGADWIIAQALLIGPGGLRLLDAETFLLRGEVLRPSIDRCAALLMRSLELGLALKYAESGAGDLLLLDGSLYADLPHLLYPLDIPEYDDLPLLVLQAYLDLFDRCQQRGVLLVGIAKSARSVTLGRAILDGHLAPVSAQQAGADVAEEATPGAAPAADAMNISGRRRKGKAGWNGLPRDSELLYRWTAGASQYLDELRRFSIWGYQDIPPQDLLLPRQLAVFDLAGTDKVVGAYAAERVLSDIWRRALSGQLHHPVLIVLEEAHTLIPASGRTRASRIINTIAAEGRKFRVFLTLITQRPSKISQDTLSQCGSQIIMQLTNPDDQHAVQKASEAISAELLADLPGLNKGEAIVLGQLTRVPVMVRVAGRVSAEGGSDVDVVAALARAQQDASVARQAAAMRTPGAVPRQREEW